MSNILVALGPSFGMLRHSFVVVQLRTTHSFNCVVSVSISAHRGSLVSSHAACHVLAQNTFHSKVDCTMLSGAVSRIRDILVSPLERRVRSGRAGVSVPFNCFRLDW